MWEYTKLRMFLSCDAVRFSPMHTAMSPVNSIDLLDFWSVDVMCFLWGTNWIYICYVEESRPPLWSSGQSSWLQIQRPGFRFPALPDFLRSSGSGTGSTQPREYNWGATWKKSSGSGLESREYDRGDLLCWPRNTPLSVKVGTNFVDKLRSLGRYSLLAD
jgi:hypothetical protein